MAEQRGGRERERTALTSRLDCPQHSAKKESQKKSVTRHESILQPIPTETFFLKKLEEKGKIGQGTIPPGRAAAMFYFSRSLPTTLGT